MFGFVGSFWVQAFFGLNKFRIFLGWCIFSRVFNSFLVGILCLVLSAHFGLKYFLD